MALLRRKAFATATQEYIEKAKMGGYIGMIYMYDELTHEYLLGWSGLDVDDSSQSLLTALLQKLVTDNRFRDLGEEENQSDLNFSKTNTNTPLTTFSSQNKTNPKGKRKRLSGDYDSATQRHNNEPVTSCTSTTYTDSIKKEPDVQQANKSPSSSTYPIRIQQEDPNASTDDEVDYQQISLDELNDSELSDFESCLEPERPFECRPPPGTDNTASPPAHGHLTGRGRRRAPSHIPEHALRAYLNSLDISPNAVMGYSMTIGAIAQAQKDESEPTRRKIVRFYARHMVTHFFNAFQSYHPHNMVKIHYAETIIKHFPALRDKEPTATGHMKLLRFDPLDGYLYVAVKNLNRYNQPGGIIRKRRRKAPAPVQGQEGCLTPSDKFMEGMADLSGKCLEAAGVQV